jgi:hypothetical protein
MNHRTPLGIDVEALRKLPGFERTDPQYFADPMLDRLLEILVLLGGELWASRDRQLVTEHLLETHGKVTTELIESFKPDGAFLERLEAERQRFLRGTFKSLYAAPATEALQISAAWHREAEQGSG